jgi:hypothetical protein
LQCSRAKQNYENYLLEEKKEENRIRNKNERNFRSRKSHAGTRRAKKAKLDLSNVDKEIAKRKQVASENEQSSDKLLQEGNKRLKEALEKADIVEKKVAQGLIDGALKRREVRYYIFRR